MVATGIGVALVPDWVQTLSRDGICFRPVSGIVLDPAPAGAVVGMSWRPRQRHLVRDDFLKWLRKQATKFDPSLWVKTSITHIAAEDKSR